MFFETLSSSFLDDLVAASREVGCPPFIPESFVASSCCIISSLSWFGLATLTVVRGVSGSAWVGSGGHTLGTGSLGTILGFLKGGL